VFFRTELLTEQSTNYAEPSIEDYDERRAQQLAFWKARNGRQSGDPAKLARALIIIANQEPPPLRFIAVAIATASKQLHKHLIAMMVLVLFRLIGEGFT
jgi:hypothetical protein